MTEHAVVIAGGGPTGLMLAGELALAGVDVAIVERRPSQDLPGARAGGLHSRTIEVLDQRGIADRFLSEGQVARVSLSTAWTSATFPPDTLTGSGCGRTTSSASWPGGWTFERLAQVKSEGPDDAKQLRERERSQGALIARLRLEAQVRDEQVAALTERLGTAEHELKDLRAIRDALTPPELPQRPGLDLAAAFLPASEQVSGDFYLVAEGPEDSTLLVIGDVVGHGLQAARRAAFVRTTFAATAPFSDDPCQLLSWANTAIVERAGTSSEFVTVACVSYLPNDRLLRWAYAGHPPALSMYDGKELVAPNQGTPLGIEENPTYDEGSLRADGPLGVLLYTDGLTEAKHDEQMFGLKGVTSALDRLENPSPKEAIAVLRARVAEFAYGSLTDDLCMLAARVN